MPKDDQTGDKPPTIIDKNVNALHARVLVLEALNVQLIAARDAAVTQLKMANDLIEADTKARLVEQALGETTMTLNELAGMDIDELETVITVSKLAKRPRFESGAEIAVKPGKDKIDVRTHLHSLYIGNRSR